LYPKGKVVECTVRKVEGKYLSVDLPGDVNGIIPSGELDEKKVLPRISLNLEIKLRLL